jgi:uncharacterized protein involved in response to NO
VSVAGRQFAGCATLAFLTHGFRPFFLAAGIWSATALAMWLAMLTGRISLRASTS